MSVYQSPLFTVDLATREWCGSVWLVVIWRDFTGWPFGIFVLEKLT